MMHRTLATAALGGMMILAASAQSEYTPPPVGTMVTWSFGNDDGRETRISEVVATGSDFVIYLSDLRLNENNPASYLVEFSGLHVASCAGDLPSEDERERLAAAWPLVDGETVEIAGNGGAVYTIGRLISHTLNAAEGPMQAREIKASYGSVTNDITLSLNWNIPVAVGWADGTGDKALEVMSPTQGLSPKTDLGSVLGQCAGLLAQ